MFTWVFLLLGCWMLQLLHFNLLMIIGAQKKGGEGFQTIVFELCFLYLICFSKYIEKRHISQNILMSSYLFRQRKPISIKTQLT